MSVIVNMEVFELPVLVGWVVFQVVNFNDFVVADFWLLVCSRLVEDPGAPIRSLKVGSCHLHAHQQSLPHDFA